MEVKLFSRRDALIIFLPIGKKYQKLHIDDKQRILKLSDSPYINDRVNHIGYPLINKDQVCNFDFFDTEN